jgi:hypothetical protein
MARWGGRRAQRFTSRVLELYGTTCHLCGHEGADSADHLLTRSSRPELAYVLSNARPAHHRPCPYCGLRCNTRRGVRPLETPGGVFAGKDRRGGVSANDRRGGVTDGAAYVD